MDKKCTSPNINLEMKNRRNLNQVSCIPTHLYASHYGSHEVRDDEVVPEIDKPRLELIPVLVHRTVHEHPRTCIVIGRIQNSQIFKKLETEHLQ